MWDRVGDVIRIEDPERGRSYEFSGASLSGRGLEIRPLTRIADRNGNSVAFLQDGDGLPVEVRHSGGYRVVIDTVSVGGGFRIEGLRLLDGSGGRGVEIVEYRYDPRGRLTEVVDSSGVAFVYEYESADRISAWIDRNGFEYRYEYDERGRVIRGVGPDGHLSVSLQYDDERRVTTVTNALGAPTEYHYDDYNHLTKVVDPLGNETLTRYDRYGRLLLRTDPLGNTMRRDLNDDGDPVAIHHADGGVTTVAYNQLRLPTEVVWPDVARWRYTYDERGNLSSILAPDGGLTRYGYDERGALVEVTDALGVTSLMEVDRAGLPVARTDALGARVRIERDVFGRVVAVTDPFGGTTRAGWSIEGRILWQERADGAREQWAYDPGGNLVEYRNPADAVTSFEYGAFSLLRTRSEPTGARYRFGYDALLRLTGVTGPTGLRWRYEYEVAGNLVGETDFDGRSLSYSFDAAGRLIESRAGDVPATLFERDELGRVTARCVGERVTEYGYDRCGRLIRAAGPDSTVEISRDELGRITAEISDGSILASEYDLLGRRVRRTTPAGQVSRWQYGPTGLPLSLSADAGTLTFEYDAGGRETSRFLGAGAALTQSYDADHRLAGQAIWAYDKPAASGSAPGGYRKVQERTYSYRPDGNPAQITDELRGTRGFETDLSGRVTAVSAATWREVYAYDPLGNLVHASYPADSGADEAQGEREYNGMRMIRAGRVSYEHDAQGRVVRVNRRTLSGQSKQWAYAWGDDNQLVQVTTPDGARWRYRYDPLGRRIAKQLLGEDGAVVYEVRFVWDQTCLAEQHTVGADGRIRAVTWDWEPSSFRAAAQTVRSWAADAPQDQVDTAFYAIVTDLVGTPSELVTADGCIAWHQTRSLWGETLVATQSEVDCPLRFPGQYRDEETGLNYNYFRHYAPEAGRYLSPDPLGLAPAPNPYGYVPNPLTWFDPLGLACLKGNQTYLYRAVQEKELSQILESRTFTNPEGIETKYFSLTEEGANAYARGAYQQWPSEGPYTIVRTTIDKDLIPADSAIPHLADRGVGDAVALPTDVLPSLGRPRILPYGLTGS